MSEEKDFQRRLREIGDGLTKLEGIADPAVKSVAKELVQQLTEMHGAALNRMLELIFQSGDAGGRIIDELGQDPEVSGLLILYGLHPDDLATRVERGLNQARSRLFKMGAEAELVSVAGGDVGVRVRLQGHSCGSTLQNVRALIEEAMYEAAPDLTSLVVEGLDEPKATGFVAMEALTGADMQVAAGSGILSGRQRRPGLSEA